MFLFVKHTTLHLLFNAISFESKFESMSRHKSNWMRTHFYINIHFDNIVVVVCINPCVNSNNLPEILTNINWRSTLLYISFDIYDFIFIYFYEYTRLVILKSPILYPQIKFTTNTIVHFRLVENGRRNRRVSTVDVENTKWKWSKWRGPRW
jgi:hypothetical protein